MTFSKDQQAYRALREIVSERSRKLVLWIGAGLSTPAGVPNWTELRETLQSALRNKANSLAPEDKKSLLIAATNIEKFSNYWVAFEMLKKELGDASYQYSIRQALSAATTARLPEAYRKVWQLPIAGILNLNLDRLASRAFVDANPNSSLAEFTSGSVGAYTHLLNSPLPWVYDLHGVIEDSNSWVFTHDELKQLTQNEAYLNFIRSVFSTSTVLFLGVTADDVAVGGHLETLSTLKIKTGPHFWITDRTDRASDLWAESAGIIVIRYDAKGPDHTPLLEALNDLIAFVPIEDPTPLPPVVTSSPLPAAVLPGPGDLLSKDSETIRMLLNREASEILRDDSPESVKAYDEFCNEYDEAIHRAWYASTQPGRNKLLGYTLHSQEAQGAFGKVYRATSAEGKDVAVKILLDEIRTQPQLLHSFRRGVRSMRILSKRGVEGMVPYQDATEIPALVVMDWIDGGNLRDAVLANRLEHWGAILGVMLDFTRIIRNAHGVPERVLHRDLRPANVMIENVWKDQDWRVVVLDFDLSWHRGALERSVIHGSGTAGYLAPEQIERIRGVSTRHSSVDSFGFGMTFFFTIAHRDPIPDQHRHGDWEQVITIAAAAKSCRKWKSLPKRVARLIINSTRDQQDSRWDMSQIEGELIRLVGALDSPATVEDADLLAEEVAARSDALADYVWDQNRSVAALTLPTGLTIEIRGDESSRKLNLSFARTSGGLDEYSRLAKWIPKAVTTVKEILDSGGWKIEHFDTTRDSLAVTGSLPLSKVSANIDQTAALADRAGRALRFQ